MGFAFLVTLALIVVVAVSGAVESTTAFSDRGREDASGRKLLESAMERIGADLRRSTHGRIVIDSGEPAGDSLRLQLESDSAPGRYGARDGAGQFREDWSVRYSLRGGALVRELLDSLGDPRAAEAILEGVDGPYRGEKGFAVRRTGDLYTVMIRVLERERSEDSKRTSYTMSFPAAE